MKVTVLWSSANADGLTAAAKNHFLEGLLKSGAEINEICLNQKSLLPCRACGNG